MKAILMAGGEGKRLRPITEEMPKPMVRIFDRPVIAHAAELLAENGIKDICFTLRYMPEAVKGYFRQNPTRDVRLSYNVESEPLGTAGGVRACGEFTDGEDVLVMSGDAVCDFDLKACIDFHYRHNADVTIVLYRHPSPLEYGLVITDEDGRVSRFSEKPSWEGVYTDLVNTGIYIISSAVIDKIPVGEPCDFGRDLFPRLLEEGARIYGVKADGYWCDIGSIEAYLSCCRDALSGRVRLHRGVPEVRPGVFSESEIPEGAIVRAPVYIGRNVQISDGAVLGPGAMIMENSSIGPGANITGAVSDGANMGREASATGAYLGRRAVIGDRAAVEENCAVGNDTVLGADCRISQGVKIWPKRRIEPGDRVRENITGGTVRAELSFDGQGIIRGRWGADITPEICLKTGAALARFETAAVSHTGGAAAELAAGLIAGGIRAAGGKAALIGRVPAPAAAFVCSYLSFPVSVTVEQRDGEMKLVFFGENGRVLSRGDERKIESAVAEGEGWVPYGAIGAAATVPGAADAYVSSAVRCGRDVFSGAVNMPVHVAGEGDAAELLRRTLKEFGCDIVRFSQNVPSFSLSESGDVLSGRDEKGEKISGERIYAALAVSEIKGGCRELSVIYEAPAVIEKIGEKYSARILRAGRDGERSVEILGYQPYMRDGIFEAVRLCAHMCAGGEKLSELTAAVPDFAVSAAEVPLTSGRGHAMERLVSGYSGRSPELYGGMRVALDGGWVRITPCRSRPALRIRAEAGSIEAAEELCADVEKLIRRLEL